MKNQTKKQSIVSSKPSCSDINWKSRRVFTLLGILICLVFIVITYLLVESLNIRKPDSIAEKEFQQLVHGIGLGATTKPVWCYINFDPRVDPRCSCIEWPIPGGYCYCPDHTGSVSYLEGNSATGVVIELTGNRLSSDNQASFAR